VIKRDRRAEVLARRIATRSPDRPAAFEKHVVILTVVGVTADVRHVGLAVPPRPEIFVNSMQSSLPWSWLVLAVRAHGDPAPLAESVKAALHDVNANVPSNGRIRWMRSYRDRLSGRRVYTFLLGTFAALAVMLAAIGLYGTDLVYRVAADARARRPRRPRRRAFRNRPTRTRSRAAPGGRWRGPSDWPAPLPQRGWWRDS
jgi:hypothetical protein